MANLKDLRDRISSVKSTQKITSAMKMVAAAKLRRAQERAQQARPYAQQLAQILSRLRAGASADGLPLLVGRPAPRKARVVVITSERGLCGGFNASVAKLAREKIRSWDYEEIDVVCVGRKGRDLLRAGHTIHSLHGYRQAAPSFEDAADLGEQLITQFGAQEFDTCFLISSEFESVIKQIPTARQIIPAPLPQEQPTAAPYDFEPSEEAILSDLLPRNIKVQLFGAMLESFAGEQGARMAAMDNATRNAGEMIDRLTLQYNQTRQAVITNELIEIISGAQAV
ncbi:MAG: F0F1 ATP synthase subunit gamma [Pseudomonadota bacterium]